MPSILLRLAAIGGTYPLGAPLFGLLLLLRGWLWFPFSLPASSPLRLRRPAFDLGACHATKRMVPRFSPPAHYCGSSARGFSLLRVRLTPCNAWATIRSIRGLPGFTGALQGLPRSPWRTSPLSRPSKPCPALHWLLGWPCYAGAPTGPGHPGYFTFRSEVWLQAPRTPPHGDALPVTYCFPPTGRSLDFNHAALQAARRT